MIDESGWESVPAPSGARIDLEQRVEPQSTSAATRCNCRLPLAPPSTRSSARLSRPNSRRTKLFPIPTSSSHETRVVALTGCRRSCDGSDGGFRRLGGSEARCEVRCIVSGEASPPAPKTAPSQRDAEEIRRPAVAPQGRAPESERGWGPRPSGRTTSWEPGAPQPVPAQASLGLVASGLLQQPARAIPMRWTRFKSLRRLAHRDIIALIPRSLSEF